MKLTTSLVSLSVAGASAFIAPHNHQSISRPVVGTSSSSSSPTCLLASQSSSSPSPSSSSSSSSSSRRAFLAASAVSVTFSLSSTPAHADIDYSKVQDLLGVPSGEGGTQTYTPKGSRPSWLTEPTEEFKANEAKSSEFKRAQLERKRLFVAVLEKLDTDPNEADLLVKDLDDLGRMVAAEGGLPLGITKEEVIKRVRRRKAKRFWPTPVEIAYQDLVQEINFQQSPNTEKDMDNPF